MELEPAGPRSVRALLAVGARRVVGAVDYLDALGILVDLLCRRPDATTVRCDASHDPRRRFAQDKPGKPTARGGDATQGLHTIVARRELNRSASGKSDDHGSLPLARIAAAQVAVADRWRLGNEANDRWFADHDGQPRRILVPGRADGVDHALFHYAQGHQGCPG